jgi:hypothetical protein
MSKYMHNKMFECKGSISNLDSMGMMPCKFIVTVSNDKHCTVSFAPDEKADIPIQYSVDFTKVLKSLEG